MKKKILISLLAIALLICVFVVGIIATDTGTTEFKIKAVSLTVGVDLRMNIKVQVPENVSPETVKLLVWEGDVVSADKNYTAETKTVEENAPVLLENGEVKENLLVFTYDGITAKEMGKTFYARAYYEDSTSDNAIVYTETIRHSLAQNLWGVLALESTTDKEKAVIDALMAYGDAAQELGNVGDPLPKISDGVVKVSVSGGKFADGFTEGKFLAGEKLNVTADTNSTTTPTLTAELGAGFLWTTATDYSYEATVTYSEGIYVGKYENAFKVTVGETSTIYTDKTLAEAVQLANGGTVTLLGNVDLGTDSLYISSEIYNSDTNSTVATEVTLELNGCEIKSSSGNGAIDNRGNLTIEDNSTAKTGKITATGGAVNVYNGTVNINGGTFTSDSYAVYVVGGEAIISGGTFTGDFYAVYVGGGEAIISGGTFTGDFYAVCVSGGEAIISGGTFDGALNNSGGTLNITGGTFNTDPTDYVDTTAYTVTENEDGTYTVTATSGEGGSESEGTGSESEGTGSESEGTGSESGNEYVATVTTGDTTTNHTDLGTAFAAANGGTVTLLKDVSLASELNVLADTTVTLDLNGYDITCSATYAIYIFANGKLTIQDTTGGTITGSECAVYVEGGTVNIEGGTFKSSSQNINNFGGTVNISGGTFTGEYSAVYVSSGETTITGGTFSSDPSEYVASGYAATANEDGTYTVAAKAQ